MEIMWMHSQINQTKLDAVENRLDHDEGNLCRKKSHRVNLRSPLSKNLLIKKWAVTTYKYNESYPTSLSKIPTYNWTYWPILVLAPNPTGLVLVETFLRMDPSMWLTKQQLDCCCLMQSYSISKLIDLEAAWYINLTCTKSHSSSCKACISIWVSVSLKKAIKYCFYIS